MSRGMIQGGDIFRAAVFNLFSQGHLLKGHGLLTQQKLMTDLLAGFLPAGFRGNLLTLV